MKSIIIGAGKVGFSIAQLLSSENQDVVVIEQDEERAKLIEETLDVQVIQGSGASWSILEMAGVKSAEMVVAVTEYDELNMIACLLAKQYGVKTTIARVRNPEYVETPHFSPESLLGIDLIINPERVTAEEIAKIVKNPEVLDVEYYADGKVQLVELVVPDKSPVINMQLRDLDTSKYVIVSIVRKHKMIVPSGNDVIKPGDHLYIMANTNDMAEVLKSLGIYRKKVEHLTILGAGRTGCYLAHILEREKIPVNIKIIEKNEKRAREVSARLKHSLVIHGDGSDLELLENENIEKSDLFVAVTDDDKINLLSCLIAKNLGAKKTIAKIKRADIMPLMEQIGIDIVLSPRILTAGAILKYIRKGNVVSVTVLGDERAELLEFFAQAGSVAVGKELKRIKFPSGSVVGAIVRNGQVIIPNGNSVIKPNDQLMVFSLPHSIHKVEKIFTSGGKNSLW
ncbi:trk system potassium uptake protein TrkA [Thermosyntropha lipolytica DSM 11003]|uniref:Trk system potassium uptake protein TrkA n=1 Tax=Thermosyntropha lipolytica DSM 11003 TaxID=1123382 RepID=A0A1M5LCB3_9FIRM|nr:Trk system potassium transporter TrkA [Thermosyntropha lipolytica]SHG62359.1 trk system potassium uptake protein TrkA [Thermosyntropha lipolytica DSM 11003]